MERLLKCRLKDYNFNLIKVECYDRFDGDNYICRKILSFSAAQNSR